MKAQHTPGPWVVGEMASNPDATWSTDLYGADGDLVATAFWHGLPTTAEANARLIAVAPEMYKTLVELRERLKGTVYDDYIGELIAEIEGEQ